MLPQIPVVRIADAQKLPLPTYSDGIGTCMILRSAEAKAIKIASQHYEIFSTGLALALPIGMEAQIRSLKESTQNGVIVLNAPLTIDASDRSEVKVCIYNASSESVIIKPSDPIALMVFSLVLRVNWHDLTPKIVEKIHLSQVKNEEQIVLKEERKKQAEEMVASMIVKNTEETSETNRMPLAQDLEKENTFNEITAPQQSAEGENIETTQNIEQNISKETENQNEETINETSVSSSVDQIEEIQDATPVEQSVLPPTIPESSVANEPIAPPAILAEFEKIESDFKIYQTEEDS